MQNRRSREEERRKKKVFSNWQVFQMHFDNQNQRSTFALRCVIPLCACGEQSTSSFVNLKLFVAGICRIDSLIWKRTQSAWNSFSIKLFKVKIIVFSIANLLMIFLFQLSLFLFQSFSPSFENNNNNGNRMSIRLFAPSLLLLLSIDFLC